MLLRLMSLLKVKEAALAGFDGYTEEGEDYMKGYFGAFQNAREEITGRLPEKSGNCRRKSRFCS